MSTARTLCSTDPLIKIIYSQLEPRLLSLHESPEEGIEALFFKKLIPQKELYTQVVKSYLTTISGEALGVNNVSLTKPDIDNLRRGYYDEEVQDLIAVGKRENVIKDPLSGRDMEVIYDILSKLKKDSTLYKSLLEDYCISNGQPSVLETNEKAIIMISLENAGLLPVIQYIICDSLLTGGLGSAQTQTSVNKSPATLIKELSSIIATTDFTLEDFFTLGNEKVFLHKSIFEMAISLDCPEILLAVLQKERFLAEDIQKIYSIYAQESLWDMVISNGKKAIKNRMEAHLSTTIHTPTKKYPNEQKVDRENTPEANAKPHALEVFTPTRRKFAATNGGSAIKMSPYGSGRLHLHASNAKKPLHDTILCLLVTAVSQIIHAAESYISKYPCATSIMTAGLHTHTHQQDANLLIQCGTQFHRDILNAANDQTAKIALDFLLVFERLTSRLSSGELSKMLLTDSILSSLSVVAKTIINYNFDQNTKVEVKKSLGHLSAHSSIPDISPRLYM